MVAVLISLLLAGLYALLVLPSKAAFLFRMFIGLIITWPVLVLYGTIELPAGVPDIHYHRAYIGFLIVVLLGSVVLSQLKKNGAGELGIDSSLMAASAPPIFCGIRAWSGEKEYQRVALEAGQTLERDIHSQPARFLCLPFCVIGYLFFTAVALVHGLAVGISGSDAIATFGDAVLIPVCVYLFTKYLVDTREKVKWLLWSLLLALSVVCLTGLYERVLDLQHSAFPIAAYTDEGDTRYLGVPGGRAAGVMASPVVYGALMGFAALCSAVCMMHSNRFVCRAFLSVLAFVFVYAVFVSYTRAAWISVFFAAFCAQFYIRGLWKITVPLNLLGCALLFLFWSVLQSNDVMQNRVLETGNITGRLDRFIWSWEQFLEAPILGQGPGALDTMFPTAFPYSGFMSSHNTYMTILVDKGVLVFVFLVAVIIRWLRLGLLFLKRTSADLIERSFVAALLGLICIWVLCGMSTELSYFTYFTALLWIAGGCIEKLSLAEQADENRSQEVRSSLTKGHTGE
jgi:hypothetical protein